MRIVVIETFGCGHEELINQPRENHASDEIRLRQLHDSSAVGKVAGSRHPLR